METNPDYIQLPSLLLSFPLNFNPHFVPKGFILASKDASRHPMESHKLTTGVPKFGSKISVSELKAKDI